MTRRLAIIPARGGSKRIPRKNIADFCGKPMISYILNTANLSGLFNTIHVSTEDEEIFNIASNCGFQPMFWRPNNLAKDSTPLMPVLKQTLLEFKKLKIYFDEVWLLMPCAPLIEPADLIAANKVFRSHGQNKSVLSVAKYRVPVEWAFKMDNNYNLIPEHPGMFEKSATLLKSKFHDAGVFAIFSNETIIASNGPGTDKDFIGYELPVNKAIDIDTFDDWELAEAILYNITNKC